MKQRDVRERHITSNKQHLQYNLTQNNLQTRFSSNLLVTVTKLAISSVDSRPDIRCEGVILVAPRPRGIHCLTIHRHPRTELTQTLLKYWN